MLSHLRAIERDILGAENLNQRLATFFSDFIEQLVLKDFEFLYKTNHPYRFKQEILTYAGAITHEGHIRGLVIEGYIEGELAADPTTAGHRLDQDLYTLRAVFDTIEQTFTRIDGFRQRLEARLRNTVRYAEQGDHRHTRRLTGLIARLDQAVEQVAATSPDWLDRHHPEGLVMPQTQPWSPALLAEPRAPRQPVPANAVRRQQDDPVLKEWRRLLRAYNDMFMVETAQVVHFPASRVLPGGRCEARYLPINTVEDFLAFEQLRRFRHAPPEAFANVFTITEDATTPWRDDAWLRCANFIVRPVDPELNDKQVDIRPMVHLLVDGTALDRLDRFAAEAESASARARRSQAVAEDDGGEQDDDEGERT